MPALVLGYLIFAVFVAITQFAAAAPVAALMSFHVISPTFTLAGGLAGGLLAADCAACLVVVRLFDRERLITGTKPSRGVPAPAAPQDIRFPDEVGSRQ